jgi:acyl carrier protein
MMTNAISDRAVLETTLTIIIDELELELAPEAVDLNADLVEYYGADSLSLIQVLARVNKELSIRVSMEKVVRLHTVGLLVDEIIRIRDGAPDL